jgi:hypothetical protein
MATKALRKNDFEFIRHRGAERPLGALGSFCIDNGESLIQAMSARVGMSLKNGKLDVWRSFGFATGVNVTWICFLATSTSPKAVLIDGNIMDMSLFAYDRANEVLDVSIGKSFVKGFSVHYSQ